MGIDDMQTNRVNADNSMALYFGRKPPHQLIDPHGNNMSPNHRWEAAVVRYGAGVAGGRETIMEFATSFRGHGFMKLANANEFLTDSHLAIWSRIFARLLDAAIKHHDDEMIALALLMWSWLIYMLRELVVPTGPLAGESVGVGGRYKNGWNATADCCCQQIEGRHITKPRIIKNGAVDQDDFGALVVHDLLKAGAFNSMPAPAPPPMPCDYSIERHELGHVTRVPKGTLEPGDPSVVWVVYGSGKIGDDRQGEKVPDLGELTAEIVALRAVAGAGHGIEAPP